MAPGVFRHFMDLWAGRVFFWTPLWVILFFCLKITPFNSQHKLNFLYPNKSFCWLLKLFLKLHLICAARRPAVPPTPAPATVQTPGGTSSQGSGNLNPHSGSEYGSLHCHSGRQWTSPPISLTVPAGALQWLHESYRHWVSDHSPLLLNQPSSSWRL